MEAERLLVALIIACLIILAVYGLVALAVALM
jgi:hypothetical protein